MPSFLNTIQIKYRGWSEKVVGLTKDPNEEQIYGEGWERLGYQRPLGKFLYSFGLLLPQIVLGLAVAPLLKYTQYRFPEIGSFDAAAGGLFGGLYSILDLDTQPVVDRFLPQYAISDPRKAMQYVTFFIKYHMQTGLFQIAFVAIYVYMYIIPYTNFAYLAWFLLFINIQRWPAILGCFTSCINSLQHGDKSNLIGFYQASMLTPFFSVIGYLFGLYWGQANPAFGEMVGMALFNDIFTYGTQFISFILGMYWLSKIIDKYGIRMWEIYGQTVPPDVWKSALSYALRLMPNTIFGAVMGFFNFMIQFNGLPGYVTYTGIFSMASSLDKFVGWSNSVGGGAQPALSEAYNNGKMALTKYYISQGLSYNYFFFFILGSFNIFALPLILTIAMGVFLSSQYQMVAIIIPIQIMLNTPQSPYDDLTNKMINISGHPEVGAIWGIFATIINTFFSFYFLLILHLSWIGMLTAGLPASYLGLIIKWTYMKRHIINLDTSFFKAIAWQCFLAPVIGGAIFIGYLEILLQLVWPLISAPFPGMLVLFPAAILLILLLVGMFLIYFPVVSYFGFWDERNLATFRRAVALSGPSLWLIWPMYKLFNRFYQLSPFKKQSYNKLGEQAEIELKELSETRYKKYLEYLEEDMDKKPKEN